VHRNDASWRERWRDAARRHLRDYRASKVGSALMHYILGLLAILLLVIGLPVALLVLLILAS
jgi:hypothetical protein